MRNTAATVILTLCAAFAVLSSSGSEAKAVDWKSAQGCVGFIYGATSTDAWFKGLPPYKQATQQGYDAELVRKSHYVYEGTSDWDKCMNFQRAMAAAMADGWIIMDVDPSGLTASMYHPKLALNNKCLVPTKTPWKD